MTCSQNTKVENIISSSMSQNQESFRSKSEKKSVPRGYSISEKSSTNVCEKLEDVTLGDECVSQDSKLQIEDGGVAFKNNNSKQISGGRSSIYSFWKMISMGGAVFDGFLLAASQEVGQSILTLPNVFSQVGFTAGVILELVFASLALYTNYLLVSMHAEYRQRLQEENHPKHNDPFYIVSYHEIMNYLVGPWMRRFSVTVVFFALLGLSTVQIIATASNCYIMSDVLSKRSWGLLWGCIFSMIAFVPTFRHYRILSVLGILTTTYTAWFMTITSAIEGPQDDVIYDAPTSLEGFFTGFVQLLFVYGGHTSNIEVADVMDNPATYDKSYFWSYLYVFSLTLPNAVTAYHTYGNEARYNANSFNLFPKSFARDFGIIMMSLHQAVAFGLFAGPLFHMWEKLIHIHNKPFLVRAFARLPLCGFMLFLAIAFPFFGAINAVLGAFTTSFGTYIIPCVAYNLAFPASQDKELMVKKPRLDLKYLRVFNWIVATFVIIFGVGFGGYTSIKNFIRQIEHFDYFAECYQC